MTLSRLVGRTTAEYHRRIQAERRRTEERLIQAQHSTHTLRSAYQRYESQMEDELESLVRFLLRRGSDGEHVLPKDSAEAARLLATLRTELDAAEKQRALQQEETQALAARQLTATVAAQSQTVSAADAMRALAQARPAVWLKLKEQEAAIRAEQERAQEPATGQTPGTGEGGTVNDAALSSSDTVGDSANTDAGTPGAAGAPVQQQRDETSELMAEAMDEIEKDGGDK